MREAALSINFLFYRLKQMTLGYQIEKCTKSRLIFLGTLLFYIGKPEFHFPNIPYIMIANSSVCGILFGIVLCYFLKAFLYARPIVLAPLGYSLPIFITVFEVLTGKISFNAINFLPAFLIAFGCGLIIREEYKDDKKKSKRKSLEISKPLYPIDQNLDISTIDLKIVFDELNKRGKGLKYIFTSIKDQFNQGLLNRYEYISERHEFNKILLEYSREILKSEIESIEILPDCVIFTFSPLHIKMETDGAARSAPFEILNFGCYDSEDESMAYNLIKNGDTIIDVGANIGWLATNFAKRFPSSLIYAFEPIPRSYEFLIKNLKMNNIENCIPINCGISNSDEDRLFYYFKGGSAIASIENLIDHKNVEKIKCKMKTLDQTIIDYKINSVDFIKCDVEGSELFVLQGSIKVLEKFKPVIFLDFATFSGLAQAA